MAKRKALLSFKDLMPVEQARVLAHVEEHIRYTFRKGGPSGIPDLAFWVCSNLDNDAVRATINHLKGRP